MQRSRIDESSWRTLSAAFVHVRNEGDDESSLHEGQGNNLVVCVFVDERVDVFFRESNELGVESSYATVGQGLDDRVSIVGQIARVVHVEEGNQCVP